MVSNLVERLGEEAPLGSRCFPAAEAMARRPERLYREVVRAGCRAPFLLSLARAAASGRPDLEAWRDPRRLPSDRAVERWFAPYGEWAVLAMWLEVTADWHLDPPAWPPRSAASNALDARRHARH